MNQADAGLIWSLKEETGLNASIFHQFHRFRVDANVLLWVFFQSDMKIPGGAQTGRTPVSWVTESLTDLLMLVSLRTDLLQTRDVKHQKRVSPSSAHTLCVSGSDDPTFRAAETSSS